MVSVAREHSRPQSATLDARGMVCRHGLFDVLDRSVAQGRVTVVSAPPGSGKTLLLRTWIDRGNLSQPVAWASVDREDSDAQHFWMSVIDALRRAVGDAFVGQLASSPGFDGGAVVERLLHDLASLPERAVLVIDDMHRLTSVEALAELELLVTRMPPTLHLILATRHDPRLGLHRLSLAGDLTVIRARDLRFSPEEARLLLDASGIRLTDADLAILHGRTEGWAAGLRLAAVSLAGHPDPGRFVAEFSGSERMVAEYLLAEMLDRQPRDVRDLLLRTSVLDRVSGPLADFLTGSSGSERILQALAAENAFVVSLDAARSWFRYHCLFADLLRLELRRTDPDRVHDLHRAAAQWWAEHGGVVEAARHALAAHDWRLASRLLADHQFSLYLDGRGATMRDLLTAFPADAASADAELATVFAGAQLSRGSLDAAEAYLDLAEQRSATVPDQRRLRFERSLATWRLSIARRRCDLSGIPDRKALLAFPAAETASDIELWKDQRAMALANIGITELWAGRIEEAEAYLLQGVELARRDRRPYVEMACLAHLAPAAYKRSFAVAWQRAETAISIARANGWEFEPVVGIAHATLGGIEVWAGRFDEGERWLDRAAQALRPETEPMTAVILHFARGLLNAGRSQHGQALLEFRAADVAPVEFARPRILTIQRRGYLLQSQARAGDAAGARTILACLGDEDRRWGETRTGVATVLLAEGDPAGAVEALAPVLDGSAPVTHNAAIVDALLLDAIARDRLGDTEGSATALERALDIAEGGWMVLPFAMSGAADVLRRHARRPTAHASLVAEMLDILAGYASPGRGGTAPTFDRLSDSELRVLRYLPSNLSAPEIGAELHLSLHTVKTHMRHIYEKLGVHRRSDAVAHARELGLVAAAARRG